MRPIACAVKRAAALIPLVVLAAAGCTRHTVTVEPIRVEPIHLTLDINLRIDRELDEFFDFEEQIEPVPPGPVGPAPVQPQGAPS